MVQDIIMLYKHMPQTKFLSDCKRDKDGTHACAVDQRGAASLNRGRGFCPQIVDCRPGSWASLYAILLVPTSSIAFLGRFVDVVFLLLLLVKTRTRSILELRLSEWLQAQRPLQSRLDVARPTV